MTDSSTVMTEKPPPAELRGILRPIVSEGNWNFDQIASSLGAQDWMRWLELRLQGRDPLFSYNREEREFGRGNLFANLFYELHHDRAPGGREVKRKTIQQIREDAACGLGFLLRKTGERLDEDDVHSRFLYELLDLVGPTRAKQTESRDEIRRVLRDWIESEALLDGRPGSFSPELLHRCALFALAELQVQGDASDADIWRDWFDEDPYRLAAFSGMALSARPHPPEGWVREVLNYADRVRADGQNVQEGFALEALYMGDLDPEAVMWYLWREAQGTDSPRETWTRLQDLLGDTEAELLDYEDMEILSSHEQSSPASAAPSDEREDNETPSGEHEDNAATGVWAVAA